MSFRFLIAQWLAAKAYGAVQAEMEARVRGASESAQTEEPETAVEIGCVFALSSEAGSMYDMLESPKTTRGDGLVFHTGHIDNVSIAIAESGIGQVKAAKAANALLDVFRPRRLLSAGFAGALAPELKANTIVIPNRIVRDSDGKSWNGPQMDVETVLITTDHIVASPEEKKALRKKHNAAIVDMESFAIAEIAKERNIPFLPMRIVLDTSEDQIPPELVRLFGKSDSGAARFIGAAIGTIFKRPSSVWDILQLKEKALIAADLLAKEIKSSIIAGVN